MAKVALAGVLLAVASASCAHGEPPTPEGSPSIALPPGPVPAFPASPAPSTMAPGPAASTSATAAASAPAPAASVDPATLPQTHDRPTASGPAFDARVAGLWKAIVDDDPDAAMPFFFPVAAYQQVKDIPDPTSDWRRRLVAAYRHDIHALHGRLGASAKDAKLVALDLPDGRARWVDPGEEYNKIGYYRVFGTRLRVEVDGAARAFDVKSLIAWRGEWYVVHLSAIQ